MELLYFVGIMPLLLKGFSRLFTRLMKVSGAESLCASSNIFVGIEAATTVRPYLKTMTLSELCTVLTAGLATIASSILGMYVFMLQGTFPQIAAHLISASLLSAPAAIVMSKLLMPETQQPETLGLHVEPHYRRSGNFLEALLNGANAGGRLVLGVIVMLLAFLGMVELLNMFVGFIGQHVNAWLGLQGTWSLQYALSYIFYPFALIIGVPPADAFKVATLLGERAIMTEVPAYQHLNQMIADGVFSNPRSAVLAGYALCGFTHVASIAIFVGGISALAPHQTNPLTRVAFRAFVAATLACLMTACIAGLFYGQSELFIMK
jgi:CNT family concentrative nucleoside transporter